MEGYGFKREGCGLRVFRRDIVCFDVFLGVYTIFFEF